MAAPKRSAGRASWRSHAPPKRRAGGHPRQQAAGVMTPVGPTRCNAFILPESHSLLTLVVGGRLLRGSWRSHANAWTRNRCATAPRRGHDDNWGWTNHQAERNSTLQRPKNGSTRFSHVRKRRCSLSLKAKPDSFEHKQVLNQARSCL